jgi:transposase
MEALSDKQLIEAYKGQQKVERGFRFMKDPMFMASTFFLKSTKRITALLMVMTICLLVYAALEYRIRQTLKEHNEYFPDQKGNEIQNPTARWIFQFFTGIHILVIDQLYELVLNLNRYQLELLRLLGENYEQFYSDSG